MQGLKKNQLREGLKANKKLKNSFYHFIYEKHFDWVIILGSFFVLLPCVASKTWYFLIIKLTLLALLLYIMGEYLLTWNELRQYYKVQEDWDGQRKKLINPDKIEEASNVLQQLNSELQKLPEMAEKKKHMYRDVTEYLKYDKIDFIPIEDILNKDKEASKTSVGLILSVLTSILVLREIPGEEYKNYKRILFILLLTVIFFIVYAVEFWLSK